MANKTKRAAIYLRVSTSGQTVENQRRELEQVARRRGWSVVEVYQDEGISGAKGRGILGGVAAGAPLLPGNAASLNATEPPRRL